MRAIGIDEDAALKLSDQKLRGLLNRDRGPKPGEGYMQPSYADVQRQLEQHKGLTLAILWEEYAKRCAVAGRQAYLCSYFVEKHDAWTECDIAALRFFGGVPRIIVPDNLK